MKDTKMIRVTSRGFVTTSRGRVISPILSPYRESVSRIWSMLTVDRADIEEKLPDGTFLKLNAQNFDKDNYVKKEVKVETAPIEEPSRPIETFKNTDLEKPEEKAEEAKPVVVEETHNEVETEVETPVDETPVENETQETPEETKETTEETKEDEAPTDEKPEEKAEEAKPENTQNNNPQKRVDPRINKKNKNRNRNNQNGNKSLAVDVEAVQ